MSALPQPSGTRWRWPIVLGVATTVGLLSALLGDALWDTLSWLGLGAPVAVAAWFAWRPRSR